MRLRLLSSFCLTFALATSAMSAAPATAVVEDFPTIDAVAQYLLPGVAGGGVQYLTEPTDTHLPRFTQANLRKGQCTEKYEYSRSVERVLYGDSDTYVDSYPLEYVKFSFGSASRARKTLAKVRAGVRECEGVTRMQEDGSVRTRITIFDTQSPAAALPRNAVGYEVRSKSRTNSSFVVARRANILYMARVSDYTSSSATEHSLAVTALSFIVS